MLESKLVEAPSKLPMKKKGTVSTKAGDNNYEREIVMRPESGDMQRHYDDLECVSQ